MRVGIVLVHDKGAAVNAAQVTRLVNNLVRFVPLVDEDQTPRYRFAARTFDIVIFQVVPPGVTPPSNFYALAHVGALLYSATDNPCTDGQFFQAAVSRLVRLWDCDIVAVVDNYTGLTRAAVDTVITKIQAGSNFLESEAIGRVASRAFLVNLRRIFDDTRTYAQLVVLYRAEMDRLGMQRGG